MTALSTFDFAGQGVRLIVRDGEPWFIAADVTRVLGYANGRAAIAQHCKGVAKHDALTDGGVQSFAIIPERDVYRLVLRSKLPSAERFEEWVVGEVLPSIRKTGSYGKQDLVAALSDPATALKIIGTYAERVLALEGEVANALPKVEVYDKLIDTGDTLGFREACKEIHAATGAKETEVKAFMIFRRWIQRLAGRLSPAHYGQEQGYVTVRDREVKTADGGTMFVPELRVTRRGVVRAIERINGGTAS